MADVPLTPIILDASCALNLYASGRFRDIAESLPEQLMVSDFVIEQEALFIRERVSEQEEEQRIVVDLGPFISDGSIKIASLDSEDEQQTFIDLATELDDGEAITISLAEHRGYCVATDDKKALRVVSARALITSTSSLELIKRWADSEKVPRLEIKMALTLIRARASYFPGERDPLYLWWSAMMQ